MSRCGGTSGPLWGTAFIRAAGVLAGKDTVEPEDAVKVLRAAFDGISQRGGASLGDKTLLDALGPMADRLEEELKTETPQVAFTRAVETAKSAAEATANLQAKRGRASYSGERSVGSADAGALAVAVIGDAVAKAHAA
jgi:dihydroxyacetone kinase-like protein